MKPIDHILLQLTDLIQQGRFSELETEWLEIKPAPADGGRGKTKRDKASASDASISTPFGAFHPGHPSPRTLINITHRPAHTRRRFLSQVGLSLGWLAVPGAFAEELLRTPRQTEGPFYPDHLPIDTDNDLIVINDALSPAIGEITWLSGRILDSSGAPIRNAVVEIWQADKNGAYLHTKSGNGERRDANFQGFGRFLTGASGEYAFRTIKPAAYPGRAPHIHFAVKSSGREKFTTQCYVAGAAQNDEDMVLKGIHDPKAKASVIVPFEPRPDSQLGELTARFDIVLGLTPAG